MSKSETPKSFDRRSFIGAGAALGATGFALPQIASAAPPPDKFKGKQPMRPAPLQVQAPATTPPLAALVLNKAAYGPRPGLAEEQLFQDADVWALTDYRTIFSEVLLKRLHNNKLHIIFPGYTEAEYQPLGVVSGSLVDPDFNDGEIIFRSGME